MYGSVINGLSLSGEQGSDLDLIVVATSVLNQNLSDQMTEEKNILDKI